MLAAHDVKKIGKKKRREVVFTNKLYKFLENEAYRQLQMNSNQDKEESQEENVTADQEGGEAQQPPQQQQVLIVPE